MILDAFRRNEKLVWWILLPVLGIFGLWGPGNIAAVFSGFQAASVLDRPISSDEMYEEARRCFSGPQDTGGHAALDPSSLAMSLNRLIYLKALEPSGLGAGDAQAETALHKALSRTVSLPSETWSLFGPALPRPD